MYVPTLLEKHFIKISQIWVWEKGDVYHKGNSPLADFTSLDVCISGSVHILEFQNWPDLYFTLNQILIHVPVLFQLGSILSSCNRLQQHLGLKKGNRQRFPVKQLAIQHP